MKNKKCIPKWLSVFLTGIMLVQTPMSVLASEADIFLEDTEQNTEENPVEDTELFDSGSKEPEAAEDIFSDEEITSESIDPEETDVFFEDGISVQNEDENVVNSGKCGENLTWVYDNGVLTISGKGEMYDYSSEDESEGQAPWYPKHHYEIAKIIVENGVTSIGDYAFEGCYDYEIQYMSITLPSSLKSIGKYAFAHTNIESIELPSGITAIEEYTFAYCRVKKDIKMPSSIKTIGEYAFLFAEIESLELPSRLTAISAHTFERCMKLKNIKIPSSVKTIGEYAFASSEIENIELPSGITEIKKHVFYNSYLKNITLPASITSIDESAFQDCDGLTSITLPSSITSIGKRAFQQCENLATITLPSSITFIEEEAFKWCTSLTSVTLLSNITSINESTFEYCISLSNITLSSSITSIGKSAFHRCISLKTIELPSSITSIDKCAFQECESLVSIVLPSSVTSVSSGVFEGCTSLTNVGLSSGLTVLNAGIFKDCISLRDIVVPEGITKIGNCVFEGCTSLTNVTLPSGLTHIYEGVFHQCTSLTDITLPESVVRIDDAVFWECTSLKIIILPDTLKYIGDGAFSGCTNLNNIILPSVTNGIRPLTFENCTSLSSIVLPSEIKAIDGEAFSGCTNLKSITINSDITSIGEDAFKGCKFTEVWIEEGVTSIGKDMFSSCSIENISLPASIKKLDPSIISSSLVNLYYRGTAEQWEELCKTHEWLKAAIQEMEKNGGTLHCDSKHGDAEGTVCFFTKWDADNQIAYFGETDFTGSQVTDQTDLSFLENIDNLLGKYVLVEKKDRRDGMIGPSTLISIKSVETRSGVVTAADKESVTIGGDTYALAGDVSFPDLYVNEYILYHVLDNGSAYIQELKKEQGTLSYWNAKNRQLKIDNNNYELGTCAEEESEKFLGDTNYTRVYVQFWHDGLHHIYKITNKIEKTSQTVPDFYETYVPPTEAESILWDDVQEWNQAYDAYVEAVRNALRSFSGTEGEKKETTVNAEAKRMQMADQKSSSKYLSGSLGNYSDYAYKALAEYFYDYTCDNIEFSSVDGTGIVNAVLKCCNGTSKTYHYGDNIEVTLNVTSVSASRTGNLVVEDSGKQVVNVIVCSTQKEIEQSVKNYVNALQDLAVDSMVNVASAVYTDILGQSLDSLTESYVSKAVDKIERRLAVSLSEKFNLSGVGNLVQDLNECYSYYNYVNKNMGNVGDIQNALDRIKNLEFQDTTIKDKAVKKAMSSLRKAKKQFVRSYEKYLEGTLGTSNKGLFNIFIKCPVDIEVYNSKGEQIGCASETELWYDDSIEITNQSGAKTITVLTEELPSIKVISREYGKMDCTIEELGETHVPVGRLNYYDIDLTPGQEYNMTVVKDLAQNKDSIAVETNGQNILADEYVSVEESAGTLISCRVEADDGSDGGSISGGGTYIRGNAVVLSALPDTGYSFDGWYQGDSLLSLKKTYEFTARNDMVLTAKFVRIQRIYIKVKAEGEGSVSCSDKKGEYLDGETVTVSAVPDEGKEFAGWYCDGKKVSDDAEYQFTATDSIELTARFVSKETEPCKHVFDAGKVIKNATCKEEGTKSYTCTVCGEKKTESIPKAAHKFGTGVVTKKATVWNAEERTFTCTVCGKKTTKIYGSKLKATIKLNVTSLVLQKKQSTNKVKVTMANGDSIKSWKSSNKKIATVSSKGVIKAQKKTGTAKITVTLKSGKKATISVKVQTSKVKTKKLNNLKSKVPVKKGKTLTLKPTVEPFTSQEKVTYKSSNKKIATVSSKGVIKGKKKGSTTITVKSGKVVKKVKVTVK